MKKYFLMLIAFVVFCGNIQSQAPQRFNYQVIARDADGNPLINQSVNFQISILQGSAAGTAVYIETHAITTNDFGLATMAIGAGSVVTGVFSSISWGTDSYYVRTELDPTGGSSFSWVGTTQLLSVPYALYANSSGSGSTTYAAGMGIDITGSTITNTAPNVTHSGDAIGGNELSVVRIQGRNVLATPPTNGQALRWNSGSNAWEPEDAGSLPTGTNGQTLRHDGTSWAVNSLLYNDNTNIGVGTTSPSALLHVDGVGMGKGNVVFTGDSEDYTFGPVPASGAGTRMMWYPDKAAFRAGKVSGTEWDTDNIGIGSIAMGFATQATNYNTTALGSFSIASGGGATAIGEVTIASGLHSFAFGYASNATETYSYAFGNQVTASGPQSLALGNHSTASGTNSVAIGTDAYATGYLSKSIGFDCHATGNHSVALGDNITAPSMSETVIGTYNTSYIPIEGPSYFHPLDRLFVIGNGTSTSARSNALTMLKNGNTGLGTDFPEAQLHTTGSVRFEGAGTPGIGKVLTSDEIGNATWQTISGGGSLPSGSAGLTLRHDGSTWVANGLLYNNGINIGIGLTTPTAQLHTKGSVRFEGAGAPGVGKVLTSDALGNATWQTVSGGSLPSGTMGQTLYHDGSTWLANSLLYNNSFSVGIGTTAPTAQFHTKGSVRFEGAGTPGEGKVLTSDAGGNATWRGYSVGDYAHGGIIFWLDESGQHGLVACKFDQSPFSKWYAGTYGATRATGDGPLSGELNTGIIISSHVAIGDDGSLYAARICADVKLGEGPKTYGDWYLPTLNELWEMYMNRDLINSVAIAHGGTALSGEYWSSTEFDSNTAWKLSFSGGAYLQSDKAEQNRVRAIRAF